MRWITVPSAAAVTLSLAVASAFGAPVATVANGPGNIRGVALCQFDDDSMTLVLTEGGKEIARRYFCSSYGKSTADVVTDARGISYVLLRYGEGRGTNATQEYLEVFGIGKDLIEYVRTPVSAGAGALSRWYYDHRIETPKGGGIRLILTRRVDGEDALWVPAEKTRVIEVGGNDS